MPDCTPQTRLAITRLESLAAGLIYRSLAASTHRTYRTGQAAYLRFCESINVQGLPANEQLLILFTADLSQRIGHSSIRTYLAAVRHMHVVAGLNYPFKNALRLELLLRGIKRTKPKGQNARLPITPLVLVAIKQVLRKNAKKHDNIMLWAACCLGFFAFLRSGEFTLNSAAQFDPTLHITPQDILIDNRKNPSLMAITIKGSKTDQSRDGVTLYVGRSGDDLCPISALLPYLVIRGQDCGPLFKCEDGTPLTRQRLVTLLRHTLSQAGFDCTRYSGHSFRIGAATTAAAKGMSDSMIQTLGRWSSDSFRRYIRIPPQELARVSLVLSNCSP